MRMGRAGPLRGREPRKNQGKVKAPEPYWDALDEALDETFPASDPLAIIMPHPVKHPVLRTRKRR